MTYWKPLDISYPNNDEQWQVEFSHYKNFPEYQLNTIDIKEFQRIFYWEYMHRLLGRTVGVLFATGFLMGATSMTPNLAIRSTSLFLLGGMQGAIVIKLNRDGGW